MSEERKPLIRSLHELAQVPPPRDLWPAIAQQLNAEDAGRAARALASRRWRRVGALAAVLAAFAVGIGLDRMLTHQAGSPNPALASRPSGAVLAALTDPSLTDPRYAHERAVLVRTLPARLAGLSPQTRAQVMASLATIERSMRDIQAALGRDPGNALLQQLWVDTCQDEMRVLTAVQESDAHSET